jgi:hypothetical protein
VEADHKLTILGGQCKLHHPAGEKGHCEVQDAVELSHMVRFLPSGLYWAFATRSCRLHVQEIYQAHVPELVG